MAARRRRTTASAARAAAPLPGVDHPPRALLLCAVDPGLKPGAVQLDWFSGRVVRASHRLEDWLFKTPWDLAATEAQWYHRGGDADPNSLLTLAFRAGFTLACIPAARSLRIPPKIWREPYGNLSKAQVQKSIADNLTAPERQIIVENVPAGRHGDVLDAIGIAQCVRRIALTTTKYDWTLTK
jgi:hypothetical protein